MKIGEYIDREGNKKNVTRNIGAAHTSKDGRPYLQIDAHILNPSVLMVANKDSKESVFFSMYELKDSRPSPAPATRPAPAQAAKPPVSDDDPNDDIPF